MFLNVSKGSYWWQWQGYYKNKILRDMLVNENSNVILITFYTYFMFYSFYTTEKNQTLSTSYFLSGYSYSSCCGILFLSLEGVNETEKKKNQKPHSFSLYQETSKHKLLCPKNWKSKMNQYILTSQNPAFKEQISCFIYQSFVWWVSLYLFLCTEFK